ncbi:MAG: prepilin peptidase, partial [Achromobacter mucicolens]
MWRILDLPLGVFIGAAALAGLFVGNWLTVLTHRLPRMMEREWQAQCLDAAGKPRPPGHYGLWSPASHCPACEAPLDRIARIPLLGWLLLRGRCAACHAPIGWRYPVIELLTCALFAGCALRFGATPIALAAMGLSATLVALAWIDFETTLLPDVLTQPLVWAGLLVNLFDAFASVQM